MSALTLGPSIDKVSKILDRLVNHSNSRLVTWACCPSFWGRSQTISTNNWWIKWIMIIDPVLSYRPDPSCISYMEACAEVPRERYHHTLGRQVGSTGNRTRFIGLWTQRANYLTTATCLIDGFVNPKVNSSTCYNLYQVRTFRIDLKWDWNSMEFWR